MKGDAEQREMLGSFFITFFFFGSLEAGKD